MSYCTLEPDVSVIIPIYKVEDYLSVCLNSVVNQTLTNIEIICVDDGSPDHSAEIVEQYAKENDNISLIRKENGGLSSARNAGLEVAKGRYVYFLDSDDYLERDAMEKLCQKADAEQLDILYFNTEIFFESGRVKEQNQNYVNYYTRKHDYSGVCTGQSMFAKMRTNREFFPSVCLQLFRRSLISENGVRFYNGILHEDNLFSFQCLILAKRTDYIEDAFYHRRMHGDSIMTMSKSIRNVEGYAVSYAEMLNMLHGCEIEPEAAPVIMDYLYHGIYRNACNIYQDLEPDVRDAGMSVGDFTSALIFDLVQRNSKIDNNLKKLKEDNARLRDRIQVIENNAPDAVVSNVKRKVMFLPRKIKGGIQCIKDHGFLYTVRLGGKKVCKGIKRADKKLSHSILWRLISWLPRKVCSVATTMKKYGLTYHLGAWSARYQMKTWRGGPLVSFIIPVYNVEEFLPQCLDTLLQQTMHQIEIICVDDGSTDASVNILNAYAARDKRVHVYTQKNKFAGAARNLGFSYAQGEYVVFLDSDDFFHRALAEEAYFAARANRADVVLFGAKHYDNMTGKYKEAPWLLNNFLAPEKQPFSYADCPHELYRITTPCPWTKMFRRQFVLDTGLQFQHLQNSNDLFFTYSALAMAKRIVTVDKKLVYYRVGLKNNLQTTKKKNPFCFYEAYLAWHDKLEELGILDVVRQSYVNVTLSGCLHNLRSIRDPEVKRMVFDKLKYEAFAALEIPGHAADYYASKENYRDMTMIVNGSFEAYWKSVDQK